MKAKHTLEILTYNELSNGVTNEIEVSKFKIAAEFLMSALNDWPTRNLQEPKDLILELKSKLKKPLTFNNLDSYLESLNPSIDAWKMEALSALLEMFDLDRRKIFDKTIELEVIFDRLTQHYRQQNKNHF